LTCPPWPGLSAFIGRKFAQTAVERSRIDGGGYLRDHLRALAQRVVVVDKQVWIMGSKQDLLRILAAASGVQSAVGGVRGSVLKWRAVRDSDENYVYAIALQNSS